MMNHDNHNKIDGHHPIQRQPQSDKGENSRIDSMTYSSHHHHHQQQQEKEISFHDLNVDDIFDDDDDGYNRTSRCWKSFLSLDGLQEEQDDIALLTNPRKRSICEVSVTDDGTSSSSSSSSSDEHHHHHPDGSHCNTPPSPSFTSITTTTTSSSILVDDGYDINSFSQATTSSSSSSSSEDDATTLLLSVLKDSSKSNDAGDETITTYSSTTNAAVVARTASPKKKRGRKKRTTTDDAEAIDDGVPSTWTKQQHADFVKAVLEVGISNCSPSIIYDEMIIPTVEESHVNGERMKSHLQKFRQCLPKETGTFLNDFDVALAGMMNRNNTKEKNEEEEGNDTKDDKRQYCFGGSAIALTSYRIMNDTPMKEQRSISLPTVSLTKDEESSAIGRSLLSLQSTMRLMSNRILMQRRERHHGNQKKKKENQLDDDDLDPVDIFIMSHNPSCVFYNL
jgi:SHAQKYF class myb-like DNA-binding protein